MKPRAPRKKKKQAKKLKAANDAIVMVKSAMIAAQGCVQLTIITSTPFELPVLKTIKATQVCIESAKAVSNCMQEIKHWTNFIPGWRPS